MIGWNLNNFDLAQSDPMQTIHFNDKVRMWLGVQPAIFCWCWVVRAEQFPCSSHRKECVKSCDFWSGSQYVVLQVVRAAEFPCSTHEMEWVKSWSLVYQGNISGVPGKYLWSTREISLVYQWNISGLPGKHLWSNQGNISGLSGKHLCYNQGNISGLPGKHLWCTREIYLVYHRNISGLPGKYLWSTSETSLIQPK